MQSWVTFHVQLDLSCYIYLISMYIKCDARLFVYHTFFCSPGEKDFSRKGERRTKKFPAQEGLGQTFLHRGGNKHFFTRVGVKHFTLKAPPYTVGGGSNFCWRWRRRMPALRRSKDSSYLKIPKMRLDAKLLDNTLGLSLIIISYC